jgi:phosphoglucosamine mutase
MFALGEALSHWATSQQNAHPRVLLGMDTRESGPEIAGALMAGIRHGGGEPQFIGIVPTPAVAYLCRTSDATAGISISASHNPFEDNGVKIFGHDGMKLPDALELTIEEELLRIRSLSPPGRGWREAPGEELGESPDLIEKYQDFLTSCVTPNALVGTRVVLDTGFGAANEIASEVFDRVGAKVVMLHDTPNGTNINENSGALHPERLCKVVTREGAAFGVAFDGDADRAIFVDNLGNIRNGDEILYLWGTRAKAKGRLAGNVIVATVMSNFGFEKQLDREGIKLLRAQVGDKYVLEMMQKHGATLGGEQSGHIIDLTVHTTGDGLHTALAIGELLAREKRPFAEIPTFEPFPQILLNEKVSSKPPLESLPKYQAALRDAENRLGERGRILVRYSGTENLVRVMVEGENAAEIGMIAKQLRDVLKAEIGGS